MKGHLRDATASVRHVTVSQSASSASVRICMKFEKQLIIKIVIRLKKYSAITDSRQDRKIDRCLHIMQVQKLWNDVLPQVDEVMVKDLLPRECSDVTGKEQRDHHASAMHAVEGSVSTVKLQ